VKCEKLTVFVLIKACWDDNRCCDGRDEHPRGLGDQIGPVHDPNAAKSPVEGRYVRGEATKHRNWGTIFPDRTQVRQVVVRHMWALPSFFFEICCPNGSPGHSQRSYPGKEGRI